jgi:hypothetical protein
MALTLLDRMGVQAEKLGDSTGEADHMAKLKGGPPLPYRVLCDWPVLPNGSNFGQTKGVDVDQRNGNVWSLQSLRPLTSLGEGPCCGFAAEGPVANQGRAQYAILCTVRVS